MDLRDPLTSPPPPEVHLGSAPLVRVLFQVRFPIVASVEKRDFIAPFQNAVRETYPVLRQEQAPSLAVGPAGSPPILMPGAWRFSDRESRWRLSLAPDFLALETSSYTSRRDFLSRLRDVVLALGENVHPPLVDRVGLRYIDRIEGDAVEGIATLVRDEVRGIAGTSVGSHAIHSLCESLFKLDDLQLRARWGHLPPDATVDPNTIEPVNVKSWILDLDAFVLSTESFSTERVLEHAERFAQRIYAFFRWAVTDEFLCKYGGKP